VRNKRLTAGPLQVYENKESALQLYENKILRSRSPSDLHAKAIEDFRTASPV
jgi:hypothetical protein